MLEVAGRGRGRGRKTERDVYSPPDASSQDAAPVAHPSASKKPRKAPAAELCRQTIGGGASAKTAAAASAYIGIEGTILMYMLNTLCSSVDVCVGIAVGLDVCVYMEF